MLSMVFMIIAIPFGFIAMWSVDKYGLRTGVSTLCVFEMFSSYKAAFQILLGSWVNVLGAAIRVISSIPQLNDSSAKYAIVLTGMKVLSLLLLFDNLASCRAMHCRMRSTIHHVLANEAGCPVVSGWPTYCGEYVRLNV